ncbi:MAG TPA: hypothetical protein VGY58_03330 [Gemmataceae bacterium]|nr:hypothetical protein [Gemmataceae bacterium]
MQRGNLLPVELRKIGVQRGSGGDGSRHIVLKPPLALFKSGQRLLQSWRTQSIGDRLDQSIELARHLGELLLPLLPRDAIELSL